MVYIILFLVLGWLDWVGFNYLVSGFGETPCINILLSYSSSSIYLCSWATLTRKLVLQYSMNILVATFSVESTIDLQRHYFLIAFKYPYRNFELRSQRRKAYTILLL